MANKKIFQIYYDDKSFSELDENFIPLDNRRCDDSGWYEFLPIHRYLSANTLDDDHWYGFLSPKFTEKSKCDAAYVDGFLDRLPAQADVAIFSPGWDQLCYFQNPWEQGEVWHPSLTEATQKFLVHTGRYADLQNLVTDVTTSVFSNYLIAKKRFWLEWKAMADDLLAYVALHPEYDRQLTSYGSVAHQAPMKAFMQERMASYLLATSKFKTVVTTVPHKRPIFRRIFPDGEKDRKLLGLCDHFKRTYLETKNPAFLRAYQSTRKLIPFKKPYL